MAVRKPPMLPVSILLWHSQQPGRCALGVGYGLSWLSVARFTEELRECPGQRGGLCVAPNSTASRLATASLHVGGSRGSSNRWARWSDTTLCRADAREDPRRVGVDEPIQSVCTNARTCSTVSQGWDRWIILWQLAQTIARSDNLVGRTPDSSARGVMWWHSANPLPRAP